MNTRVNTRPARGTHMTLFGDKGAMAYRAGKLSDEDSTFRFGYVYVRLDPSVRTKEAYVERGRLQTTSTLFFFVYAVASGGVCWKGNVERITERRSCPVIR